MYHPVSENRGHEFVELLNTGPVSVDLSGWSISGGVEFVIPAGTTIQAGGNFVLVADAAAFSSLYPTVTNFAGDWTGQLSNASDNVRLRNAANLVVSEVTYADDGDWAERRRDTPDHGHSGWLWHSDADGGGKSLELIRAGFECDEGQNWASSAVTGGTPGSANSMVASNLPCIIDKVSHFPVVPQSNQIVTVSCRVRDDAGTIAGVSLHFRVDGAPVFTTLAMFDDGSHGDAIAGDGTFAAQVPAAPNGARVEFYVSASDGISTRTWPAPARSFDGTLEQSQNCIYQVDDEIYSGAIPLYRIVMRSVDAAELAAINANTGTPPFPFNAGEPADQTHSHARFNATFVSFDGAGAKVRYNVGVRNRGNGSRTASPPNYNVHFSHDDNWNNRIALVLNSQNTPYQLLGSTLLRKAGLAGSESRAVRVRVNHTDPTGGSSVAPTYGFYACNEFPDSVFTEAHFPLDAGGNVYRGQRISTGLTPGGTDLDGASLKLIIPGPAETLTLPELYAINFRKETNNSEDDWSDLIALTTALAKGFNGPNVNDPTGYDPGYETSVEASVNVQQWVRWLAVNTLIDNEETNISNGDGDDFYLYFGRTDPRSVLLHHDLDTILGRSTTSNSATHGIFRMCDAPDGSPTALNPFVKHPKYAPMYYAELQRLLDGPFLPSNFEDTCGQMLGPVVDASVRTAIKNFNSARHTYVSGLIQKTLTVSAVQALNGSTLSPVSGFPQTTNPVCILAGFAPAVETRAIAVNGQSAIWSAWDAKWTATNVSLTPGVNRVLIQAFGEDGEIARTWQDVWYFDGDEEVRTGILPGSETWTAAGGPYRLAGDITVAAGDTLTIQPGATVIATAGTGITVASGGALIAEGTESQPIRFMSVPGGGTWDGILVNGTAGSPPTRISHAHISGNSTTAIDVNGGEVFLDAVTFGNPTRTYLELENASYAVTDCIFPPATTAFEMVVITGSRANGVAIFRRCFFGKTIGAFDTIDAFSIQRPGPTLHIIDNVFSGSDDDILDIDNADAWVEGNVFFRAIRNGTGDASSAIGAGSGSGEITVIGNIFAHCDHAVTVTDGNFMTLMNNTIIAQGDVTPNTAAINLLDSGTALGAGVYAEGNLFHSIRSIASNATGSAVTLNNNLLPFAWTGSGSGNTVAGALLRGPLPLPTPELWNFRQVASDIRSRITPIPQSPAHFTGPNGTDKGGVRNLGVSLSGAPTGITAATGATILVGTLMQGFSIPTTASGFPLGSGWTHYSWRLDGGAWSAETSTIQPIVLNGLSIGLHQVQVIGKTDGGLWQNNPLLAAGVASAEWSVDTSNMPIPGEAIRINEVLALNTETLSFGSESPDVIELYNSGASTVDISGWGLTDNSALPFKFSFTPGTTIPAGGYLIMHATSSTNVPTPRTGFSLKREGDSVTLSRQNGNSIVTVDSVHFGRQLADHSVGRAGDGTWALCKPTLGSPNILAERAATDSVVINEWLAAATTLSANDFIELHNPSTYPVDIGGTYLTDNPSDWPARNPVRALTFIEPGGYIAFLADGNTDSGPEHLNFKIDALQGEIGFLSADLLLLNNVVYGPQRADISEGLTPNGAGSVASFNQPTPGGPNPAVAGTTSSTTLNLVPANQSWIHFASGTGEPPFDSANNGFALPAYNDAAWTQSSQQLFYIESAALGNVDGFSKATAVSGITATRPFQTYYFRTHFNYSGPLTGVTLSAKVMCDDGANIYLNGGPPTRVRMNAGATGYLDRANASVGDATVQVISIPASDLVIGDNVIAVSVHQANIQSSASPSSDIVWGMKLDITTTTTFPVVPVVMNEVLVANTSLQNPDSSFAGWVELLNTTSLPIDIGNMSLSDDVATPRKFVFPTGTIVPGGGRHVIYFNALAASSPTNTGWALNQDGGTLAFYHIPANAGALHDSIAFGRQIPNFSLGRVPDGSGAWTLAVPSHNGLNTAAALGQANDVKLNEWRSDAADFFELFNAGTLPVDIGGNYLTDNISQRTKFLIPSLTFIGTTGNSRWQTWTADGSTTSGHVNFTLSSSDSLAFSTFVGNTLDLVPQLGSQPSGLSAGRFPEGSATIVTLVPTPGTGNQVPVTDTDNDGMPDGWELSNGLNPSLASDATLDPDGDGQNNLAEYVAGTNPHFSGDALRATMESGVGGPVIRFVAVAGKTYTVQRKATLADPAWIRVGDVGAQPTTGVVEVQDPGGASANQRFYRIITPAQP